ncbi:MAG: aldo/keto reductase [Deltaproteobacteria bacterium]|nr:MAG: aldo/keto reductase [Deltaproteobacteria bacterium]
MRPRRTRGQTKRGAQSRSMLCACSRAGPPPKGPRASAIRAAQCRAISARRWGCGSPRSVSVRTVVDTAINYRNQRSERAVAVALRESGVPREQVVLCTKGGYLPFDLKRPHDMHAYIEETWIRPGVLKPEELVDGCHSLAPRFLDDQIERSRRNLAVECIDLYYLHNPETQLGEVPRPEFQRRLRAAFESLERACTDGRIAAYGLATWNGFRLEPDDAGGTSNHFRAVQLPFNIEMDEAAIFPNQGGKTLIEAAREADVAVFASASVLQGRLTQKLPQPVRDQLAGLSTDAQRALQFARSAVTCALVGMKTAAHVEQNAALSRVPPLRQ